MASSVSPPAKIILKNSTKISLNDRFSNIMKSGPKTVQNVRAQMASDRLASEKNRRLAKQMESRPAVAAALGGGRGARGRGSTSKFANKSPNKALHQRLGVGNVRQGTSPRGRGRGRAAMARQGQIRGLRRGGASRNSFNVRGRGGGRGGYSGHGQTRGRGRGGQQQQQQQTFNNNGNMRSPTRGGNKRGMTRGGRGRGRGRGAGRGAKAPTPASKEDLDSQLDSYMSKTKGHLDKELDAYMAEAE